MNMQKVIELLNAMRFDLVEYQNEINAVIDYEKYNENTDKAIAFLKSDVIPKEDILKNLNDRIKGYKERQLTVGSLGDDWCELQIAIQVVEYILLQVNNFGVKNETTGY